MGVKLLWTAVAVFLVSQAFLFAVAAMLAAVLAIIGCVLMWMDK